LAFNGTDVVEAGLDLDHEQGAGLQIEGEQIDPAVRSALL